MNRQFLVATAFVEVPAGLALLFLPRLVFELLLAVPLPAAAALLVGRIGGAALLALGIACWIARGDRGGPARFGLLSGTLVYNVGVAMLLGYAGSMLRMAGALLWPALVLHAAFAVWSLFCLRRTPR